LKGREESKRSFPFKGKAGMGMGYLKDRINKMNGMETGRTG
jgi:hypothetical protein